MELTEFLLARITEDEAWVTLVSSAPPKWSMTTYPHDGDRIPVAVPALTPARALVECEAKRRIVKETERGWIADELAAAHLLALLALPYADHPDYRQEWKL